MSVDPILPVGAGGAVSGGAPSVKAAALHATGAFGTAQLLGTLTALFPNAAGANPATEQAQYQAMIDLRTATNLFSQAGSAWGLMENGQTSYISNLYTQMVALAQVDQQTPSTAINQYYNAAFGSATDPTGMSSPLASLMSQMIIYGKIADGTLSYPQQPAGGSQADVQNQLANEIRALGKQGSPDPVLANLYANASTLANAVAQSLYSPYSSTPVNVVTASQNILGMLQGNFSVNYFNANSSYGTIQDLNQAMMGIWGNQQAGKIIGGASGAQSGDPLTSPVSLNSMYGLVDDYSGMLMSANAISAMANINQQVQSSVINQFSGIPVGTPQLDPKPADPNNNAWAGPNVFALQQVYASLGGTGSGSCSLYSSQALQNGTALDRMLSGNSLEATTFNQGVSGVLQTLESIPLNTNNTKNPPPNIPGSSPSQPMTSLGQALATGDTNIIEQAWTNAFDTAVPTTPGATSIGPQNAIDRWNSVLSQLEGLQGQVSQRVAQSAASMQANSNQIASVLTQMITTLMTIFQSITKMTQ